MRILFAQNNVLTSIVSGLELVHDQSPGAFTEQPLCIQSCIYIQMLTNNSNHQLQYAKQTTRIGKQSLGCVKENLGNSKARDKLKFLKRRTKHRISGSTSNGGSSNQGSTTVTHLETPLLDLARTLHPKRNLGIHDRLHNLFLLMSKLEV